MNLCSDNVSSVDPKIMQALHDANQGSQLSYGQDDYTKALKLKVMDLFEHNQLEIWPVIAGSAANALSLSAMVKPFGATLCHKLAHIEVDECGAPELYTGGSKLLHTDYGLDAKISQQGLEDEINRNWKGNVHHVQPQALSLTQITEMGTHYSKDELTTLSTIAKKAGLFVHMDGARFANALDILKISPAEMTWKAGIDILSFGATKNGALASEMVISFNPALNANIAFMRKRGGHLLSKMRYVSAQLLAYIDDGLYLDNAKNANQIAQSLKKDLTAAGIKIEPNAYGNMLFVHFPLSLATHLRKAGHQFYDYSTIGADGYRLVTSWNATQAEANQFIQDVNLGK